MHGGGGGGVIKKQNKKALKVKGSSLSNLMRFLAGNNGHCNPSRQEGRLVE